MAGAAAFCAVPKVRADVYSVIIVGKVVMPDGSPPGFTVSVERECSDFSMGNGPLTDKKGVWIWRLDIDVYEQRACVIRAHHDGYVSTEIDGSNINSHYLDKTVHVPDIMLMPKIPDPYTIHMNGDNFPPKAKGPFDRAIKALDAHDYDTAVVEFKGAVGVSPKFAEGWHALGVVYDKTNRPELAREAFTKAIEVNPRLLTAYVTLTRSCLQLKDWKCALDTSDRLIRLDLKRLYTEIYLHRAVARFQLKDLAGAEEDVNESIRLDPQHKRPREEYVLGRILEEKGDVEGARTHMIKYLELEPTAQDAEQVQSHMFVLGKPEAKDIVPALELL